MFSVFLADLTSTQVEDVPELRCECIRSLICSTNKDDKSVICEFSTYNYNYTQYHKKMITHEYVYES